MIWTDIFRYYSLPLLRHQFLLRIWLKSNNQFLVVCVPSLSPPLNPISDTLALTPRIFSIDYHAKSTTKSNGQDNFDFSFSLSLSFSLFPSSFLSLSLWLSFFLSLSFFYSFFLTPPYWWQLSREASSRGYSCHLMIVMTYTYIYIYIYNFLSKRLSQSSQYYWTQLILNN